jgi:hypothetical protein
LLRDEEDQARNGVFYLRSGLSRVHWL